MRPLLLSLLVLAPAFMAAPAMAQSAPPIPEAHVTIGQSAAPLNGPWKFTVGDSPIDPKTGQPLWAEPGFDDSKWETVDLKPNSGAVDPLSGLTDYIPGWTVRGHAGYWGYAWYRIRVHVEARQGERLALAGPSDVDDIYQVFANGSQVGHFGDLRGSAHTAYYSQPMMFLLPSLNGQGAGNLHNSSTMVLAYRVFMLPSTLTEAADVGGFHTAPVLGDAATVTARYQLLWLQLVRGYALTAAEVPLFGLMAAFAFTLILFDRSDPVYHWMGALFLLQAVSLVLSALCSWTQLVSIQTGQLVNDALLTALTYAAWVIVWWVWFGKQRPAWTPRAAWALALLYIITAVIGQDMIVGLVPHSISGIFLTASMFVRILFLALQLWIVFQGIRRQGLEGGIVLPAVLLWGVGSFAIELSRLHLPIRWGLLGISIRLNQISNLLLVLVVAVLLLRRLLHSIHTQRQLALDVKQAQEVQQVMLPEAHTLLPGLAIESEYRPAREVGGDFFQIIRNEKDGSLLIVAGDVTGKGLKAGMLVALLVGAIRSTVELNSDPVFILQALNRRLLGRNDAQATCLALHIAADGSSILANAGHLPPYVNGEPLTIEGTLPLGMLETAEPSLLHFKLKNGDKLVLISDGIAEATSPEGKLFGFDRVHQLLRSNCSATRLADSAQSFGQEDDISVIAVTRTAVPVSA